MKTLGRKLCFVGVLLFISFYFTGCMTSGGRFYSGDLRSNQEVAIFVVHQDLEMRSFEAEGKPQNKSLSSMKIGEILPGSYDYCLGFSFKAAHYYVKSESCQNRTINAQPGYVYYIDLESKEDGSGNISWRVNIIDIADEADYEKIKDGSKIKNKVNNYLKGQRPEIKL